MHTSRRAERKAATKQARRQRLLSLLGGSVVIALAMISEPQPRNSGLPPIQPAPETHPNIPTSGRTLGNPSAPVTVVEWGDYQ